MFLILTLFFYAKRTRFEPYRIFLSSEAAFTHENKRPVRLAKTFANSNKQRSSLPEMTQNLRLKEKIRLKA